MKSLTGLFFADYKSVPSAGYKSTANPAWLAQRIQQIKKAFQAYIINEQVRPIEDFDS